VCVLSIGVCACVHMWIGGAVCLRGCGCWYKDQSGQPTGCCS